MQNKNIQKKLWFKRKTYGWGWTPVAWQGWLVIVLYVLFIVSGVADLDHESFKIFC